MEEITKWMKSKQNIQTKIAIQPKFNQSTNTKQRISKMDYKPSKNQNKPLGMRVGQTDS